VFIRKATSTDAFLAVDLGDVPGHGVVRLAPRILQGGAKDLARSVTYALASLERRETGVSAGVNATPDGRDAAIAAFADEVAGWDAGYRLTAGKGVFPGELGTLEDPTDAALLASGAVAAGLAACPDAGTAVVDGSAGTALVEELTARGLSLVEAEDPLTATADLLFVGARMGAIDHVAADRLQARVVVPTGPLPITTRAVAHCRRNGVLALPDFVTTAGPLMGEAGAARDMVSAIIGDVVGHGDGPLLGACERAEAFLAGWLADLPFGRPMAA
tara:strand:+ start:398 stop:1219 length:822 start_codon:yes stop_codon:yes gene_type:complete